MPDVDYWQLLMRRALGVPDHVSEQKRVPAVAWALLQRGSAASVSEGDAIRVVNLIAEMGAAGDLDGYFVAFSQGDSDTEMIEDEAVKRAGIANVAFVRSSLRLVTTWATNHPYFQGEGAFGRGD